MTSKEQANEKVREESSRKDYEKPSLTRIGRLAGQVKTDVFVPGANDGIADSS